MGRDLGGETRLNRMADRLESGNTFIQRSGETLFVHQKRYDVDTGELSRESKQQVTLAGLDHLISQYETSIADLNALKAAVVAFVKAEAEKL